MIFFFFFLRKQILFRPPGKSQCQSLAVLSMRGLALARNHNVYTPQQLWAQQVASAPRADGAGSSSTFWHSLAPTTEPWQKGCQRGQTLGLWLHMASWPHDITALLWDRCFNSKRGRKAQTLKSVPLGFKSQLHHLIQHDSGQVIDSLWLVSLCL